MQISGNTVLITGGTSGIGFELAAQLVALHNTVIITGRSSDHLAAKAKLPAVHALQSDVSDPADITRLFGAVVRDFPQLNLLINNAGIMRKIDLATFGVDLEDVTREIDANLNGTMRMTAQFFTPRIASKRPGPEAGIAPRA